MNIKDSMIINVKSFLSPEHFLSLNFLYKPIMGNEAYQLYNCLYYLGISKTKLNNHNYIISINNFSNSSFEEYRKILEKHLLIKTYYDNDNQTYLYELYAPYLGSQFLNHDVFGRLFYQHVGKKMFDFSALRFSKDFSVEDRFKNISQNCVHQFNDWNDKDELTYQQSKPEINLEHLDVPLSFDLNSFLKEVEISMFPISQRNKSNLTVIAEMGTIYGISINDMKKIVVKLYDERINVFDIDKFKKICKNHVDENKKKISVNCVYDLPPIKFLEKKSKGGKLMNSDKKLIERLIVDLKLKPSVVNVLIEYSLKTSNNSLIDKYVEKIASTWKRNDIDTVDKALEEVKKISKTVKTNIKKDVKHKKISWENTSEEDNDHVSAIEVQAMLEELR